MDRKTLEEAIQIHIEEDQAGFTTGKSCVDHIYRQMFKRKKAKHREVHLAFIDIKNVYYFQTRNSP